MKDERYYIGRGDTIRNKLKRGVSELAAARESVIMSPVLTKLLSVRQIDRELAR